MQKSTSLSLLEAQQSILEAITPVQESLYLSIMDADGYVLAQTLHVTKNLPSFDNSAMDGFAFKAQDRGKKLQVVATVLAGQKEMPQIGNGEACKIMTGAKVPPSCDTIVPIELCEDVTDASVVVPLDIKEGANLRKKGEELREGDVLFEKGEILTPSHIALLASQAQMMVKVYKPLNIAIVSTGDEIKEPWQNADEDEIYNASAFGIKAMLQRFGFRASYVGAMPDSLEKTIDFVAKLTSYDVVITSGGISMGEADFVYEAFRQNGLQSVFHGVNVKPGKPTMMGCMQGTLVMAMPGNPLATLLNIFTLSIPALFKKQGSTKCYHRALHVTAAKSLKLRSGRDNMVLGYIKDDQFYATKDNKIGSGMLTPLVESDVLAIFGDEVTGIEAGEEIKVVSFLDISRTNDKNFMNF